jgi:hypothetical protein
MVRKISHAMPEELHERLKQIAEKRCTNVTSLINSILCDFVGISENKGYLTQLEKRIELLEKEVEELKMKLNK